MPMTYGGPKTHTRPIAVSGATGTDGRDADRLLGRRPARRLRSRVSGGVRSERRLDRLRPWRSSLSHRPSNPVLDEIRSCGRHGASAGRSPFVTQPSKRSSIRRMQSAVLVLGASAVSACASVPEFEAPFGQGDECRTVVQAHAEAGAGDADAPRFRGDHERSVSVCRDIEPNLPAQQWKNCICGGLSQANLRWCHVPARWIADSWGLGGRTIRSVRTMA